MKPAWGPWIAQLETAYEQVESVKQQIEDNWDIQEELGDAADGILNAIEMLRSKRLEEE